MTPQPPRLAKLRRIIAILTPILLQSIIWSPNQTQAQITQSQEQTQKESAKNEEYTMMFITNQEIQKADQTSIIPNTVYYSNATDDPATTPTTGVERGINETKGIKYLAIESIKGFATKKEDTIYTVNQWIEIPTHNNQNQNQNQRVTISFKSKITKDPLFTWARTQAETKTFRKVKNIAKVPTTPTITVSLQTNPTIQVDAPKESKDFILPLEINKENTTWKEHSHTFENSTKTKYIHINLTTSSGYTLWLGDWELTTSPNLKFEDS